MTITLPLPHLSLRPNGRPHHMVKARAVKRARARAVLETLTQPIDTRATPWAGYSLVAYFPTRRHWDEDNTLGSVKAYLDGIADALHVDDKDWNLISNPYLPGSPAILRLTDTAKPRIEITFHPAATA